MSEASSAVAIAAGSITLSGSVFGVQYDVLLAGLAGGLMSLPYLPQMGPCKAAGSLAGSALMAGYFAPVLAVGALHYFPWLHAVGDFMRLAGAAALGMAAQALIPAGLKRLRKLVGGSDAAREV